MSHASWQRRDRYRAALLGFSIGDALALTQKNLRRDGRRASDISTEEFVTKSKDGLEKGQFSDDTQMMLALAESVSEGSRFDGRRVALHLAQLWKDEAILLPSASCDKAMRSVMKGTPWMAAGNELGVCDASCLSRAVVVGAWNTGSVTKLQRESQVATVITHKDPQATALVSAVARAVQLSMQSEKLPVAKFCEAVAEAAHVTDETVANEIFYLPRVLSWNVERALLALARIRLPPSRAANVQHVPPQALPVALAGLYAFLKFDNHFSNAARALLLIGGEVDVALGLYGAMLGASCGLKGLPARLCRTVLYGEAIVESADRLWAARDESDSDVSVATVSPLKAKVVSEVQKKRSSRE